MKAAPLGRHPGLDGLRAVAVLAVLGYHANISWLPGGFLGVDVFFVLSGFLITRLLLDEQALAGRIALGRFYARRALRLLPALALLIIAVLVYARTRLDPSQFRRAWSDSVATTLYHMNWRQALTDRPPYGRFDHAWSLGIEEQFYVLWPIALILASRRWGSRGVAVAAGLGALASYTDRVLLVLAGFPERRSYYALDSHADGLLAGATLAAVCVVLAERGGRSVRLAGWVGAGSALGIVFAFGRFSRGSLFVDWAGMLLLEAFATAVIIDVIQRGPVGRLLEAAPLVALGRISYGVYLWHWPVYLAITAGEITWEPALLAVRVGVTLALAAISWVLVERRALRLKQRLEPRSVDVASELGRGIPTT